MTRFIAGENADWLIWGEPVRQAHGLFCARARSARPILAAATAAIAVATGQCTAGKAANGGPLTHLYVLGGTRTSR